MLTKVLAIKTAMYGIRVNSVHPGPVVTDMMHAALTDPDAQIANAAAGVPAGLGLASEMASAIAFLASDDAIYCTGSALVVDGGLTAI